MDAWSVYSFLRLRSDLEAVLRGKLDALPLELIRSLGKALKYTNSISNIPIFAVLSSITREWTLHLDHPQTPKSFLFSCIEDSFGLTEVKATHLSASDSLLRCLSNSSSAKTLRIFTTWDGALTDLSARCWKRFTSLYDISIQACFLSLTSYKAIAKVPSLERISFLAPSNPSTFPKGTVLLSTAMKYAKNMTGLRLTLSAEEPEFSSSAVSLFESHPEVCRRLKSLDLLVNKWITFEAVSKIANLCPNLERIPWSLTGSLTLDQIRSLSSSLTHLESIAIGVNCDLTQDSAEWLGQTFPFLTSLSTHALSATSLKRLDTLLSLYLRQWNGHLELPDRLIRLSIHAAQGATLPHVSCLFDLTCLRYLDLIGEPDFSKEDVELLLRRCTSLRQLRIGHTAPMAVEDGPPLLLSHPKLREFSWREVASVPVFLPNSRRLDLRDADGIPASASSLRKLERISYSRGARPILESLNHLRQVSALYFSEALEAPDACKLFSFTHLRELTLVVSFSETQFAKLLKSLPRLQTLHVSALDEGSSAIKSFEWMKSPSLRVFSFSGRVEPARKLSGAVLPFGPPELLPLLSFVRLYLTCSTSFKLKVDNFPNLEALAIDCGRISRGSFQDYESSRTPPLRLKVRSCPRMMSIRLCEVRIDRLELRELPEIWQLHFEGCCFLHSTKCLAEIPSLSQVKVTALRSSGETLSFISAITSSAGSAVVTGVSHPASEDL